MTTASNQKIDFEELKHLTSALSSTKQLGHTADCSYWHNLTYCCDCGLQTAKDGILKRINYALGRGDNGNRPPDPAR